MQFSEPRVLVVSHNVFSASGNMGKTMMHMLAGISPDNLAQLYFHQEIPTRSCCLRYFRITDSNVLHALFTRRAEYRVFEAADIDESASQSRTDTGSLAKIYQFSRRRTPLIYFLRDLEYSGAFGMGAIFFTRCDLLCSRRLCVSISHCAPPLGAAAYPDRDVVRRRFLYRTAAVRAAPAPHAVQAAGKAG